jgi:SAM-dependent methyltransferase
MHESVMEYVAEAVTSRGLAGGRTLEIGSLDFNGSVRDLFTGEYVGIDRVDGEGVDQVMDGSELAFPDASFDTVVSTSALEHDPAFWLTLAEVGRVLRTGGHFILTTVSWNFLPHNEPDYYRFLPDTHRLLMDLASCDLVNGRSDPQSGGPQLTGVRRGR